MLTQLTPLLARTLVEDRIAKVERERVARRCMVADAAALRRFWRRLRRTLRVPFPVAPALGPEEDLR